MHRRSSAHTVTRSEYYRGRRSIVPDEEAPTTRQMQWDRRDALIDAPYPRVSFEKAIEDALSRLETPP